MVGGDGTDKGESLLVAEFSFTFLCIWGFYSYNFFFLQLQNLTTSVLEKKSIPYHNLCTQQQQQKTQ